MFIPANCTLTIHGPQSVTLYDAVPTPYAVPNAVPQQVPSQVPQATPQATPVATPAYLPHWHESYGSFGGYAPVQVPYPVNDAIAAHTPMAVPGRIPEPQFGNAEPPLDPAVAQMAAYLEARARDEMRKEYIEQAHEYLAKQKAEVEAKKEAEDYPVPPGKPQVANPPPKTSK